jgi:hypothetical protein
VSDSEIFADLSNRLKKLEDEQAELKAAHNRNSETGLTTQPYPGFGRHVVHVMTKHFYHDVPDGTVAGDVRDESERNPPAESRPSTYGG